MGDASNREGASRGVRALLVILVLGFTTAVVFGAANSWSAASMFVLACLDALCIALLVIDHVKTVQFGKNGITVERQTVLSVAQTTVGDAFEKELDDTGIASAAATYAFVHASLTRKSDARTRVALQDKLVELIESTAFTKPPSAELLNEVFQSGSAAARVVALGLARRDPTIASVPLLQEAITNSKSGNEQYHALIVAQRRLPTLSKAEREAVIATIQSAPYISDDPDRQKVANAILEGSDERVLADGSADGE